jgi:hypothetical protein
MNTQDRAESMWKKIIPWMCVIVAILSIFLLIIIQGRSLLNVLVQAQVKQSITPVKADNSKNATARAFASLIDGRDSGNIHVSGVNLESILTEDSLPFLKDKKIKGVLSIHLTLEREENPSGSQIRWQSDISVHGLSIYSKDYGINLQDRPIRLTSHGSYNLKTRDMHINLLRMELANFKPWTLKGTLKNAFSANRDLDLQMRGNAIPLQEIKKVATGRFLKWLDAIDVDGHLEADLSIKGNPHKPAVKGKLAIRGPRLKHKRMELDSFEATLPFKYKNNTCVIEDARFRVKEFTDILNGINVHGMGEIHSSFTVTIPEKTDPHVKGEVSLFITDTGFSSPDETKIGEKIAIKVSSGVEFMLPLKWIDFAIQSEATGFELLIDRFYGDFHDKILNLSAKGRYIRADDSIHIAQSEIGLSHMGSILLSGNISGLKGSASVDAEIQVRDLSNGDVYDFFIAETFQDQVPLLSLLEIAGKSSMKLSVQGSMESFNASGEIHIADTNILEKESGNSAKGVNIFLPVDVSYPKASGGQKGKRYGSFVVQELSWAPLQLMNLEIYPVIWENEVLFKEDIMLPVFGGNVAIRNVHFSDIFDPKRQIRLAIEVNDIDLAEVSVAFEMPRFEGRLSGNIPKVSFIEDRLLTEGAIVLELFGGKMTVSDLSVDNVFSPITSLKSSIELEDIDLGQLTGTFDFGHISGVVSGRVDDLVVVKGQAESFKASLESYRKKGVSQRISVTALKKISILGTGSSASVLDRGIYRFFDEYRYSKLGFRAFLKNDNLLLLGVENEGDIGYLVKGGILPPKVDVLYYNQNIPFQEIVRRLKRIKQIE